MTSKFEELIQEAKKLLDSQSKNVSIEKRAELAVELTALLLQAKKLIETRSEKKREAALSKLMQNSKAKAFASIVTDSCFRSKDAARIANQFNYLLKHFGPPPFLHFSERFLLKAFQLLSAYLPKTCIFLLQQFLRKETAMVILPGEEDALCQYLKKRKEDAVRVNLNRLGEAILGEKECQKRLQANLLDLQNPLIEMISVKISTLYSQINLLAWDHTLSVLKERLRILYRACKTHKYVRQDGKAVPKFVNLDMEEYKDFALTLQLFQEVLDEPEFHDLEAGIVLQSYLPDSYAIHQNLTYWALKRHAKGGAPIKIRLVKGANLAMEIVEASIKGWPQAPYTKKSETDANFIRMLNFALDPSHAKAVHIGVGSHNLFDVAYALIIRQEKKVDPSVVFEMLEGMADPLRRTVQKLAGEILLYSPCAKKAEFHTAIAYLMRRLDENTAPENFLPYLFDLTPQSLAWQEQEKRFLQSCQETQALPSSPRRTQNRLIAPNESHFDAFVNEPDTDFSREQNRDWTVVIRHKWREKYHSIPCVVAGMDITSSYQAKGYDPSHPQAAIYDYCLCQESEIEQAIIAAAHSTVSWAKRSISERSAILKRVAHELRLKRADLIGAMLQETAKAIGESDPEISEAIDFAEYYAHQIEEYSKELGLAFADASICLVATPWNFSCSIPTGGIAASLACGNSVIFKPALESPLVGFLVAECFWKAGVPKDVLQFVLCRDEPYGTKLIQDARIQSVILTGATATARHFLEKRPSMRLFAETGGKNSIIVSNVSDRDLAVKDIIQSAFGYAGQKCSACSLLILHEEVYNDPQFQEQLFDAARSLAVSSSWDPATKINPLIRQASPHLLQAMTCLEQGESWLLKPSLSQNNPNLWSPGIKWGVKPASFAHVTEFFGPHLSVIQAKDLEEAIEIANATPYGLTAGLHSLDPREQEIWLSTIQAGNCYVNRGITGAIVGRQPFGGCKASSFGIGMKAGGPNYLLQLLQNPVTSPSKLAPLTQELERLHLILQEMNLAEDIINKWVVGTKSYVYWWNHYFEKSHSMSQLIGQENTLFFKPRSELFVALQYQDNPLDALLVFSAAVITKTRLTLAQGTELTKLELPTSFEMLSKEWGWHFTSIEDFVEKLKKSSYPHIRLLSPPTDEFAESIASVVSSLDVSKPSSHGRLELMHFVREVALSYDYHRYGNVYQLPKIQ